MSAQRTLTAAIHFINQEADLLDQGEFREWLALWQPQGMYIIPVDRQTTDFANALNYAYDNQAMREKRVHRLYSGESISTTPRARTIRMIGRHRLIEAVGGFADKDVRPHDCPCLGDGVIILTDMNAFTADAGGNGGMVIDHKGNPEVPGGRQHGAGQGFHLGR